MLGTRQAVLVHLGFYSKNIDWVAYQQQKFVIVLEVGKSNIKADSVSTESSRAAL